MTYHMACSLDEAPNTTERRPAFIIIFLWCLAVDWGTPGYRLTSYVVHMNSLAAGNI